MLEQTDGVTKRVCGPCSLCCKLLGVKSIEKPRDSWCPSCRPGKGGCTVHTPEKQPQECMTFECLWLQSHDGEIPDHWRPDKLKIILTTSKPIEGQPQTVVAWVDPTYAHRLKWPEVSQTLMRLVTQQGIDVSAIIGPRVMKLGRVKGKNEIAMLDPALVEPPK